MFNFSNHISHFQNHPQVMQPHVANRLPAICYTSPLGEVPTSQILVNKNRSYTAEKLGRTPLKDRFSQAPLPRSGNKCISVKDTKCAARVTVTTEESPAFGGMAGVGAREQAGTATFANQQRGAFSGKR